MKSLLTILALGALLISNSAFAWYTGPGLYVHNGNGNLMYFASSFNGNAWSMYVPPVTPPPTVPPVTPPTTPPVTPPAATPPAAAPQQQQASSSRSGWARAGYPTVIAVGGTVVFMTFAICQKEKERNPNGLFARVCWHPDVDPKRMQETERQLGILNGQVN
jgi:hypothetical protein